MRIVIETSDSVATTPNATGTEATTEDATMEGGAGPKADPSASHPSRDMASDMGGPPEWLTSAIAAAQADAGAIYGAAPSGAAAVEPFDVVDAGSGPQTDSPT